MNTCRMIQRAQRRCERQRSRALVALADARLHELEAAGIIEYEAFCRNLHNLFGPFPDDLVSDPRYAEWIRQLNPVQIVDLRE